jgi:hypothetical protein
MPKGEGAVQRGVAGVVRPARTAEYLKWKKI